MLPPDHRVRAPDLFLSGPLTGMVTTKAQWEKHTGRVLFNKIYPECATKNGTTTASLSRVNKFCLRASRPPVANEVAR